MGAAAMGALRAMARAASSAETLGGNGAGSRCAKNDRGTEGNNAACMEWNVRDVSDARNARNARNAHNARDERTPGRGQTRRRPGELGMNPGGVPWPAASPRGRTAEHPPLASTWRAPCRASHACVRLKRGTTQTI